MEGEIPPLRRTWFGHQIVGEVTGAGTPELPTEREWASAGWAARTGVLVLPQHLENLCDAPTFTGYGVDGGQPEYAVARPDFVFLCLRRSILFMRRRYFAQGLSVFAACV